MIPRCEESNTIILDMPFQGSQCSFREFITDVGTLLARDINSLGPQRHDVFRSGHYVFQTVGADGGRVRNGAGRNCAFRPLDRLRHHCGEFSETVLDALLGDA
jgi:hypothetical protein